MSVSAASSIESSSPEVSAGSSSSASLNKYDPVRMGSEECILRISDVAKKIFESIPPKDNGGIFNCPWLQGPMIKPVIIWPCTHRMEQPPKEHPLTNCPTCRGTIEEIKPDLALKELIDKWQQEDRIPTLAHYKEENKKIADLSIQLAQGCEEEKKYDDALSAYTQAFLYTKKSEVYEAIPGLYKKLEQPEKATLAYLYLAMYQLQEGKVQQAIETLASAKEVSPNPLKIDAVFVALALDVNPSQEQINKAILIASTQKDPEDAIAVYKQVIATNQRQLDVYMALCRLLKDPEERNHLLLKAAGLAELEGNAELASTFRTEACPTSISEEDWRNPAAYLAKLPPKPQALQDYLAAPCPIFGGAEGKTRAETHIVFARPKDIIINGVSLPFTFSALDKLDKATEGAGYRGMWWGEALKPENNLDTPPEIEFEWLVMTKDVLPESRHKDYAFQENLARANGYEVPGFRDAATCILWENRNSGTRFYTDDPRTCTYTRCHEMLYGDHLVVGCFTPDGLHVSSFDGVSQFVGVAGLRKF